MVSNPTAAAQLLQELRKPPVQQVIFIAAELLPAARLRRSARLVLDIAPLSWITNSHFIAPMSPGRAIPGVLAALLLRAGFNGGLLQDQLGQQKHRLPELVRLLNR